MTAFAGLASLPVIQDELVIQRHMLTDKQLNEAGGAVGRECWLLRRWSACAIAGWLAMIMPAVLIIPLLQLARRRVEHPLVKPALQTVIVASAGLLLAAAIRGRMSALSCSNDVKKTR